MVIREIGEDKLPLRFNIIARVRFKRGTSIKDVKEMIRKLPRANAERKNGFYSLKLKSSKLSLSDDEQKIVNNLILFEFRRYPASPDSIGGEEEPKSIQIFLVYPDLIIFVGEKQLAESAYQTLELHLKNNDQFEGFERLDFEYYYLLKIFEILQEYNEWARKSRYTSAESNDPEPSREIAKGVEIHAVHDVNSELERHTNQAKIVIARDSTDSTSDLSSAIALLEGRKLKSMVMNLTMNGKSRIVRISRGGRLFIKRPIEGKKKEQEINRILWAIELALRLFDAYTKWKHLPIQERVPSDALYDRLEAEVKKLIKPLMKNACKERKRELANLRKDLKYRESNK